MTTPVTAALNFQSAILANLTEEQVKEGVVSAEVLRRLMQSIENEKVRLHKQKELTDVAIMHMDKIKQLVLLLTGQTAAELFPADKPAAQAPEDGTAQDSLETPAEQVRQFTPDEQKVLDKIAEYQQKGKCDYTEGLRFGIKGICGRKVVEGTARCKDH